MNMCLRYSILLASFYHADPFSVSKEQSEASGYLIAKWGKMHAALDVNHDGLLTSDDTKILKEFYAKLDFLGIEQRNYIPTAKDRLLRTYLLGGDYSEVSKDEFVEMLKTSYESDKDNFTQTLKEFDSKWFHLADLDNDNFLSKEECLIDMASEGHTDTLKDEALFNSHELVNGRIPVDEAIEVFLRFLTEDDPSKTDIVNTAFDSGF